MKLFKCVDCVFVLPGMDSGYGGLDGFFWSGLIRLNGVSMI